MSLTTPITSRAFTPAGLSTPVRTPRVHAKRFTSQPSWLFAVLFLSLSALPSLADPVSVTFTATQVSGSEWRYVYHLAGSFAAGDDLALYFPEATSAALQAGSTATADFTSFVLQPNSLLPADGEFDLVASISDPSLATLFSASFLYSGPGSPGAQAFAVFDSSFNQIASGTSVADATSAPVPEPGSLALLGSGALALWQIHRRRC